jgi:uncharacterized protein (DUF2141 family)
MRRPRLAAWPCAAALCLAAAAAPAAELRVRVEGVPTAAGRILVALYDGAESFASGRRLAGVAVPAREGAVTAVFGRVPPGRYGVAVLQDLDGDGELRRNWLGMPAEPFGFSNDALGRMGPPGFEAMAFEVAEPVTEITLHLRR